MKTSFCFLFVLLSLVRGDAPFFVGVGRYDVTGPAAEVNMMGYANPTQTTHGIHFRQYSRAFIFVDAMMDKRVVFVNIDICMGTQAIKIEVVKKLQAQFGDLYNTDNVILSGTHTHSGPAGFFQYVLFEVTSLGFVKESLDAVVDGIVQSIAIAHANIQPSYVYLASGNLTDANINRSPTAYLMNPPEERAKYSKWGNTDKEMVVLKIANQNLKDIGMISWFAVHCTSMNNTNHLISGDNKGRASQLMEMAMNKGSLPGQGAFVAAFAQSNEGDVSPNTKGPHCLDSGKSCDILHSTCDGKNELCVAAGPGKDMFDSTDIIGMKQFTKGQELHNTANIGLNGPVDYRHMFVDMSNHPVTVNGTQVHTCPAAMGYSFAAGTTDGPGAFDFTQADTKSNPFWNLVRNVLHKPSPEQIECHKPKPILLDTGKLTWPYPWHPSIVPLQIARIGQLILVAVPGEFSTMSGRRLRETVYNTLIANGYSADTKVVIAGLSNTYTHYITTFEEYQEQRYEGASTIYGPHTLMAYQQEFASMAQAMAKGSPVPAGPSPPNYLSDQKSFLPPVLFDRAPLGKKIGDVHLDAKSQYSKGDNVTVIFWAGNPRNNLMVCSVYSILVFCCWSVSCTALCCLLLNAIFDRQIKHSWLLK
jgi:neutral ceramidase